MTGRDETAEIGPRDRADRRGVGQTAGLGSLAGLDEEGERLAGYAPGFDGGAGSWFSGDESPTERIPLIIRNPALEFEAQVGVLNMEADPTEVTPVFDALLAELGDETLVD